MRLLATGAGGYLGTRIVRRALQRRYEVRGLVRRRLEPTDGLPMVHGDLASGRGVEAALEGIDALVHVASDPFHPDVVDVQGTRRLIELARRSGVAHVVYVSITGIDRVPLHYYRCKLDAERMIAQSGLPYSILRASQFHGFVDMLLRRLARVPGEIGKALRRHANLEPAADRARVTWAQWLQHQRAGHGSARDGLPAPT